MYIAPQLLQLLKLCARVCLSTDGFVIYECGTGKYDLIDEVAREYAVTLMKNIPTSPTIH